MPETLITSFSRSILACAVLLGAVVLNVDARAQMNPGPPPPGPAVNPVCPRLEAQLATIDQGGGSSSFLHPNVGHWIDSAAAQAPHILRQPEDTVRIGTGQISLEHQLCGFSRTTRGQADFSQRIRNETLNGRCGDPLVCPFLLHRSFSLALTAVWDITDNLLQLCHV